eukprot:TRINITY_DN6931_c0_g2_i1.p1 TRINITY_DN6931_c0_g2~~TRINITY_DN6931_c0_g2_i1.p1  ORF type:complete len:452 (-),score=92.24 TRINITY_DN6931_c0_g2_i1:114-1469(-)
MKKVYTTGRPPWYDATGSVKEPFMVGICGGTASGKTTVCQKIIESLQVRWVLVLSMDSFYKVLTPEQKLRSTEYNFDHPDAFDVDLIVQTLQDLKAGKAVEIPEYDFKTHSRSPFSKTFYGADVIIFEGILAFYFEQLRDLFHMKIFVDDDPDIRLARRVRRDIAERGRDLNGVLNQYDKFVKPSFENYIYPTKKYADIIVPQAASNTVAIELITEHIRGKLGAKGFIFDLMNVPPVLSQLPPNVILLPQNNQIQSIHTLIRDQDTSRGDFIFHSHRLSQLLINEALNHVPYLEKVVNTPTGSEYQGIEMSSKICGVSIVRAGESMEKPLKEVLGPIPIMKILIQSDEKEPRLFYCSLDVKVLQESHILLLDPLLGTGATAMMAIRVLLEHGADPERILFLNLISSKQGLSLISYMFPKVRIVTSAVDAALNSKYYIVPGIGNYGDRYFGT